MLVFFHYYRDSRFLLSRSSLGLFIFFLFFVFTYSTFLVYPFSVYNIWFFVPFRLFLLAVRVGHSGFIVCVPPLLFGFLLTLFFLFFTLLLVLYDAIIIVGLFAWSDVVAVLFCLVFVFNGFGYRVFMSLCLWCVTTKAFTLSW